MRTFIFVSLVGHNHVSVAGVSHCWTAFRVLAEGARSLKSQTHNAFFLFSLLGFQPYSV